MFGTLGLPNGRQTQAKHKGACEQALMLWPVMLGQLRPTPCNDGAVRATLPAPVAHQLDMDMESSLQPSGVPPQRGPHTWLPGCMALRATVEVHYIPK